MKDITTSFPSTNVYIDYHIRLGANTNREAFINMAQLQGCKSNKYVGVFMIIEAIGNMLEPFFESFLAYFMESFFQFIIKSLRIV